MEKPTRSDLVYWINERWSIRQKRAQGLPPPWSEDRIFNTVRFCNVHREDDRVTKWIRKHWNFHTDAAWKFTLGRLINLPSSLERIDEVGQRMSLDHAKEELRTRMRVREKVFTSAYTISTCGAEMDKLDYVFGLVSRIRSRESLAPPPYSQGLASTARWLQEVDGIGSFLAGQIVADMKNTRGHPLDAAHDWWTWSTSGPGSLRGLSWYFYQQPTGVTAPKYAEHMNICMECVLPQVSKDVPRISAQDFQNCLCEFSKWCKVKYGNGHVRNTYDPFLSESA